MILSREQLTVFFLMLSRKELYKRELLNMGHKAVTIHSLDAKGLLQLVDYKGEQVVKLTMKSFVFESQLRILETKHPNVRQEGHGTYMMRLAKMIKPDKKEAPLKLENRAVKMLLVTKNFGGMSVDIYRFRGYYVDMLPLLQRYGLVRISLEPERLVHLTDKGGTLIQELNNVMNSTEVVLLSRQGKSDEEILELKVAQAIKRLGYKEDVAG